MFAVFLVTLFSVVCKRQITVNEYIILDKRGDQRAQ